MYARVLRAHRSTLFKKIQQHISPRTGAQVRPRADDAADRRHGARQLGVEYSYYFVVLGVDTNIATISTGENVAHASIASARRRTPMYYI
jgi:hypothetical protein